MSAVRRRRVSALLAGVLALGVLAGCATTISGAAKPGVVGSADGGSQATDPPPTTQTTEGSSPGMSSAGTRAGTPAGDPAYPTAPRSLPAHPADGIEASIVEGRRLAEFVVDPSSIDPAKSRSGRPTLVLKDAKALGILLVDPQPDIAEQNGMYAGFVVTRLSPESGTDPAGLITAVFEFPDQAAAKKAARELSAAGKSQKAVAIPGLDDAIGSQGKAASGPSTEGYLPLGSVVAYVYVDGGTATEQLELAGKALVAQRSALSSYTPTPVDALESLPIDPSGVSALTLPPRSEKDVNFGAFGTAGALHFVSDWADDEAMFDQAGVDAVGLNRSIVFRAKDPAGAQLIRQTYIADVAKKSPDMEPFEFPAAADTRCLASALNATYYCAGAVGRYAFEYNATDEDDLKKSVIAQLSILRTQE